MPAVFIISYDLMAPGKNYESLWTELRRLGAKPILLSQWAGRINAANSGHLMNHLRQYIDPNDRILVTNAEVARDWAGFNLISRVDQM